MCLSSAIGIFLPASVWDGFVKFFDIGPLPDSPLFFYVARLTAATYALVGVFLIILALDPAQYRIMIPFTGIAAIVLGIVCAITGFAEKMPNLWFLGDALSAVVLGVLILIFRQQAKQAPQS